MDQLLTSHFWLGLGTIIWVNIILSGDNAVVIALAARSLPGRQQKLAILWGAAAAVVLRIILTIVAVKLLEFPYLKLAGGRSRARRGRRQVARKAQAVHSRERKYLIPPLSSSEAKSGKIILTVS